MTDSRHYNDLAEGRVYRFCPHRYTRSSIQLVHGVDERIAGGTGQHGVLWLCLLLGLQRLAAACNGCRADQGSRSADQGSPDG
jgi:hypothetical protein